MKNKHFSFLFILLGVLGVFLSCDKEMKMFNRNVEKKQVEEAIRNSIGWAKNKDLKLLYSTIANDSNYTEVDPGDHVIKSFEEFQGNEAFWIHPDFKAISFEIHDLRINFSKDGTVAWWFCILDDINEWKGQPANWENTRWTGVLEKREGAWVIVQMHFSFARE